MSGTIKKVGIFSNSIKYAKNKLPALKKGEEHAL